MEILKTDCLVIGAGLAGLSYASEMAQKGYSVIVIDSGENSKDSNSMLAQGGIVYPETDHLQSLADDIKIAGSGIGNAGIIEKILALGRTAIDDILIDYAGVKFDKNEEGELSLTREGGHREKRIIYAKDETGRMIMRSLSNKVSELNNITIMSNSMVIDLMTPSHNSLDQTDRFSALSCVGAFVKSFDSDNVLAIYAKKTILATGGVGQIYRHTTNSQDSFGHGIAMAKRIGARIMDMEYIQFHPTVFLKAGFSPLLITEAVRGEGGVIIDEVGKEVMTSDIHHLESLAPRDIVARTITLSLLKSRYKNVYIDLRSLGPDFIKFRFPNIYENCLARNIDIAKDPIPVVPAAHYSCGGVYTDEFGQTNILGLGAIGETACTGFHGGNRLASTSLLECLAMGKIMADYDEKNIIDRHKEIKIRPWVEASEIVDEALIEQDLNIIRETLWNYCGPIRNSRRLVRASRLLNEMDWQAKSFYRNCKVSKSLLNLRSAIDVSKIVLHACWNNQTSVGCHYREN